MIGFQGGKNGFMSVARNCFIAFRGVMPIQHQQFTAYEGVASGPQVMLAYESPSLPRLEARYPTMTGEQ